MKATKDMPNGELILRFIEMHPDIKPIHTAIGNSITKQDVEQAVDGFFAIGYVTIIDEKPKITAKGLAYLKSIE